MSLIVARKYQDRLYIVGDTRLNNPNNLNRVELVAPAAYSQIKILIINPHICVSFAGDKEPAQEALQACRRFNYRMHDMLDYLLAINRATEHATEFIVCASLPPFYLYEIKNGEKKQVEAAWIGLQKGFAIFQQHFHGATGADPLSNMENAMTAVIESNVLGVNGFLVTVTNLEQQFFYKHYIKTYFPPRTYSGAGMHVVTYGTTQEGGYTVHVMPSHHTGVLVVHVPQNRMGIIYALQNTGFLEPEIFKDVDEHEFIEITSDRHGIQPPYSISSKQKSYFERGNKAAEKRHFEKAIYLYDLGLHANDDGLKPDLYFNTGVCYYHLNRLDEGMASFKEAVQLKSSMQPKVFQFIAMYTKNRFK
jgi:tetratricopeptide (TPR) repeat protein